MWHAFLRRYRRNRLALFGAVLLVLIAIAAAAAPLLAPYDPYAIYPEARLQPPGLDHWLGTDPFGRDILSRVIYGARVSLQVAAVAVGIALLAGTLMGTAAGYFGRWTEAVLSRITDAMFAFPDVLLALVIMAILGPSLTNLMIAIAIVYTPVFARVAQASVKSVKENDYVGAARAGGVSPARILARHVWPNALSPVLVQASLSVAFAILAEAALSFLGLGVEPDRPSWGVMLNQGKRWMEQAWWVAVFPGVAITLAVLAFNLVGDGLREALDPREE